MHKDDEVSSCGPTIFETKCHQPSSLTNIMLLLLAGDVSLNPGHSGSNESAPFSKYVTSKKLDIVAMTET